MKKYDYLIVGSGLFGAVFSHYIKMSGRTCLIIDKRRHIGGNVRTENIEGINVHMYGPHIFHCNDDDIWTFVNKFTKFNNFVNRPKVFYKNKLYSFPINLFTLYQIWGVSTPEEAKRKLEEVKIKIEKPKNLEEWVLSQVGEEIYYTFIYGYTKKQWGREPNSLPSFIIKRLPIRLNFDDNYFMDKYQGIPIGGYTQMLKNMIGENDFELGVDYLHDKEYWNSKANKIIYTGMIDEFYKGCYGYLEYRGLRFEHEILNVQDYQGNAYINYTEYEVPYTRICEHKHFEFGKQSNTVITKEYPSSWKPGDEAFYPVNDEKNNHTYSLYKELCSEEKNMIFGGRLADYKYYDMHQVIGSAMARAEKELS
jgi:UDP-galactopyranose mutase